MGLKVNIYFPSILPVLVPYILSLLGVVKRTVWPGLLHISLFSYTVVDLQRMKQERKKEKRKEKKRSI